MESARLAGDNGELDLTGKIQWQEVLAWQAEVSLRELSSSLVYPDYPATLSGTLSSIGRLVEGQPQVGIELHEIRGVVND